MKKIDKLLLKSFAGPFVLTFVITLFVLVMQFLWKYVDDLIGKGLEWYLIVELLFFFSASVVSLALPLAVLLSSMMTMGSLAEHYELTALKSAGLSLIRISRALVATVVLISIAALLFANYVLPVANLKVGALLYDIRQKRPALNIKPGVFYNGLQGYSIRVGSKDADGQTIYDVLVYDHHEGKGDVNVLYARKGKMTLTEDRHYMFFDMYDGKQYEEMENGKASRQPTNDQARIIFEKWKKVFDLTEFKLTRTQESLFRDDCRMLNISQLGKAIDSLEMDKKRVIKDLHNNFNPFLTFTHFNLDSFAQRHSLTALTDTDTTLAYKRLSPNDYSTLYFRTIIQIRNVRGYTSIGANEDFIKKYEETKHKIEYHRKFTLSVACFLLFLIGAPLGAIIRKGGLGMPFVISVVFFVFFYSITVGGEKFAIQGSLSPAMGMWISSAILFPIGLYLLYKASRDSALFKLESWGIIFKKLQFWKK